MGFTVEDMLLIAKDKYDMKLLAGENGWANSISWLLMVEDTTITTDFRGKELVVTTGLGFQTEEKLLELVKILDQHHSAGLIVNTGKYILDMPSDVRKFCDEHDLPLLTVPWDVVLSEMVKDLTVRIFFQSQTDEQISLAFIKAIEKPYLIEEYREELAKNFAVDSNFQAVVFTTEGLDEMDSMERKRIGYRLQIYLENISHNAHFFYYDGKFVLILNAVDSESKEKIIKGFLERAKRRMSDYRLYVGEGSTLNDIANVGVSYRRADFAASQAKKKKLSYVKFDEAGCDRLFYSLWDDKIMNELGEGILKPVILYDQKHHSDLEVTLYSYLKNNGSVQLVAKELFIHKNTIVYRMNKIKELLNDNLDSGEACFQLFLACKIRAFQLNADK